MSTHAPTRAAIDESEALFAPAPSAPPRQIELSTEVQHAGRAWRVTFAGYTLDEASAVLDRKGLSAAPSVARNEDAPNCPKHGRPMKVAGKGGWFCPAKDDAGCNGYCEERSR